jgi:hypothetical protein
MLCCRLPAAAACQYFSPRLASTCLYYQPTHQHKTPNQGQSCCQTLNMLLCLLLCLLLWLLSVLPRGQTTGPRASTSCCCTLDRIQTSLTAQHRVSWHTAMHGALASKRDGVVSTAMLALRSQQLPHTSSGCCWGLCLNTVCLLTVVHGQLESHLGVRAPLDM